MNKISLCDGVRVRKELNGYLLYLPGKGEYLINETGNIIIQLLTKTSKMSVKKLKEKLSKIYKISPSKLSPDVNRFIKILIKIGAIKEE
jgi:hypothetical protein